MARSSFQKGCLFSRGKTRKMWVARWREPVLGPEGTISRVHRSTALGPVSLIPTRREAQNILDAKLKDQNHGLYNPESALTFGAFCSIWEETALPLYRESTSRFYKDVLHRWILPSFQDRQLREIRPLEIQTFINQFASRYSNSVLKHLRATISRIMATAVDWEYLRRNPALGVKTPRGACVHRAPVLPPSDIARIIDELWEPYKTMITLIAPTGMRESELLALSWEDIDFDRGLIRVRRSYYRGEFGPPKTGRSGRVLHMTETVRQALTRHRSGTSSTGLVFPGRTGKPYEPATIVAKVFKPIAAKLGLPAFTWRSFRRSASTTMQESGVPVRTAQEILGHSSPQTTLGIYTEATDASQREAIQTLDRLLFPNVPKSGAS